MYLFAYSPRSEVHNAGLWHRTGILWAVGPEGVLLQQRDPNKDLLPGVWAAPVGGHVSAELGLEILSPSEFQLLTVARISVPVQAWNGRGHNVFDYNYVMRREIPDLSQLTLEEGAVSAVKWIPIDRIEADLCNGKVADYVCYGTKEKNLEFYDTVLKTMRGLAKGV